MGELPNHVRRNRSDWDRRAHEWVEAGRSAWAQVEPTWGMWGVAESELGLLPADCAGLDSIELGCGTGYVSAWLARRGARPVGIDNSARQLETARALQREFGIVYPLLHGNAEQVPLPGASFDLAISEYGACLWADPERWIPEASRLLRPGGRLVFLTNAPLQVVCTPDAHGASAGDRLLRPLFGLGRVEWSGEEGVEFHLPHGTMLRLLRSCGFEVEDLIEVRPPAGATSRHPDATLEWSRRWPCEEVWKARRRS
ncbi:MAG TPA: class I SAM-dependent methyltransferase [Verrucomicrobiae bacterium]|nr:class I SAM-dependent methyltransferase [Verrucomicrobiae bacterium]